jgi:hypothetical protein
MAQRSRFWDGTTVGDATVAPYDAGTEFSEVMTAVAGLASDPNKGGLLSTISVSMLVAGTLRIGPFEALVYGAWYQNDANTDFVIATPASATRIDTVVLRKSWAAQTVRMLVITGTEGGSAPSLVQTPGVTWDVPIATVSTTTGGVSTITPTNSRADLWYRTSQFGIRTDNYAGVGVSVPTSPAPNPVYAALHVGNTGSIRGYTGSDADVIYLASNTYLSGVNEVAIRNAPAVRVGAEGGEFVVRTYASVAAGAVQTPNVRVRLTNAGTHTLFTDNAVRGYVVGDPTGGGQAAQQRYVSMNWLSASGANANSAATCIELAAPNPNPMGIDFHVPNVAKWGGLYMHGAGSVYLGRDIGWGIPQIYMLGVFNFGYGRLYSSPSGQTPFIDGQNGGFLLLGGGHNGGNAVSVAPATHNATHLGWGDRGWALVHSVSGLVQDSAVEAKTNIVPLEPEAGLDAIRNTQPVRFAYKPPMTGPIKRDVTRPMDMKLMRDRMANYSKNIAFSTQHGFVLGSPEFPCDPLFETGKGQMNPANSVGVLIAALRYMDTYSKSLEARIAALEGA